jgi:hypothetical protein
MPALMRIALVLTLVVAAIGCGKEIGDECVLSSDCSPNGDRLCDTASSGGYCTIQGCDFNTCPEESACVRFFTGNFANKPCDPATEDDLGGTPTNDCSLDELCSFGGACVPRSSEVRFCMRTCEGSGDCRDGYECRDLELMRAHGGEPVLTPGAKIDDSAPKFCAVAAP